MSGWGNIHVRPEGDSSFYTFDLSARYPQFQEMKEMVEGFLMEEGMSVDQVVLSKANDTSDTGSLSLYSIEDGQLVDQLTIVGDEGFVGKDARLIFFHEQGHSFPVEGSVGRRGMMFEDFVSDLRDGEVEKRSDYDGKRGVGPSFLSFEGKYGSVLSILTSIDRVDLDEAMTSVWTKYKDDDEDAIHPESGDLFGLVVEETSWEGPINPYRSWRGFIARRRSGDRIVSNLVHYGFVDLGLRIEGAGPQDNLKQDLDRMFGSEEPFVRYFL